MTAGASTFRCRESIPRTWRLKSLATISAFAPRFPSEGKDKNVTRYEQTLVIPQFLDLEKLTASHRHGMLRLTLPLKDSVKPRRVQIETEAEDQKRLVGAR